MTWETWDPLEDYGFSPEERIKIETKWNLARKRSDEMRDFRRSFSLVIQNMQTLNFLLTKSAESGSVVAVKLSTNGYPSHLFLLDYHLLMATCSLFSFNEMKKRIFKDYEHTNLYKESENNRKQLLNGKFEFLLGLRNFVSKYGLAPWVLNYRYHPDGNFCIVSLDREGLLKWNNWSATAKKFIRSQPEQFYLANIITEYLEDEQALFPTLLENLRYFQRED